MSGWWRRSLGSPARPLQTFGLLAGSISQFLGRKGMEAELQDSEERVRLLLDSTAESIYGIDLDGNCTFANRACCRAAWQEHARCNHHTRAEWQPVSGDGVRIFQAFRRGEEAHVDDEVLWRRMAPVSSRVVAQ